MATYILLITLGPEGQIKALADPEYLLAAADGINITGVTTLGCYAVLGSYDFVTIVEADGNEEVAMFSIELGVKAGVHITTLPAVPVGRLEDKNGASTMVAEAEIRLDPESSVGM